jgi:hypothetical protein
MLNTLLWNVLCNARIVASTTRGRTRSLGIESHPPKIVSGCPRSILLANIDMTPLLARMLSWAVDVEVSVRTANQLLLLSSIS